MLRIERKRGNYMRRISTSLLATGILVTLAIFVHTMNHGVSVPTVHAQSGCTDASLSGNFGFTLAGFISFGRNTSPTLMPAASVGLITFDGAGHFTTTYVNTRSGAALGETDTGTYDVKSNCSASLVDQTVGTHYSAVIVGAGNEVLAIQTDPGDTQTIDAKKQ
jgi:hypothetical protein